MHQRLLGAMGNGNSGSSKVCFFFSRRAVRRWTAKKCSEQRRHQRIWNAAATCELRRVDELDRALGVVKAKSKKFADDFAVVAAVCATLCDSKLDCSEEKNVRIAGTFFLHIWRQANSRFSHYF